MEYQYIATTPTGEFRKGTLETSSKEKVREYLQKKNLLIISIHPKEKKQPGKVKILSRKIGWGKSALLDKIIFARHLSVMLRAGLSLTEALVTIEEQTASNRMKQIIQRITENVNNGKTLASGLEEYPKIFSGIFIGMVKVGEASGTLERNLDYIATELEKDYELRRKIKAAMLYPVIVLTATIVLGIGLTIFILPKIVDMFSTFKLELPLATKIFLSIATFLVDYGLYVLVGLIIVIILLRVFVKTETTRPIFHRLYLRLPFISGIVKNINITRFSRALATLLKSGITINESLGITSRAVDNVFYQREIESAVVNVKKGKSLASTLEHEEYFPKMVNKMVSVGEKTGNLEESLSYLADFYEEEVNNTTKNISTVVEPILLVVIGVVLGFLAVAIISPIYQFTGSLSR